MVDNVKLEIAIQIVAENIADIFKKMDNATNLDELNQYKMELSQAFEDRDKVAFGEIEAVNRILKKGGKHDEQ